MTTTSLQERLAGLDTGRAAVSLCNETVSSVLGGAARLTGLNYLDWLYREVRKEWELAPTYPYCALVKFAWEELCECSAGLDSADEENRDYYFRLLYQTAIEPFALMEQKRRKENETRESDKNDEQ